ncbi:2743_t:CDS:2, partial [Dentiscutata heterogama]
WNKAPMINELAFEAVEQTFQDTDVFSMIKLKRYAVIPESGWLYFSDLENLHEPS